MGKMSEKEWITTVYNEGAQALPEDERPGTPMIEGVDWRKYIETQRAGGDVTQLPGYKKEIFEKDEMMAQQDPMQQDMFPALRERTQQRISKNYAANRAHVDTFIAQDGDTFEQRKGQYSQGSGTLEDSFIEEIENTYSDELMDYGVFEGIEDKEPAEKFRLIEQEWRRVNSDKVTVRDVIGLNLMRAGYGQVSVEDVDKLFRSLPPQEGKRLLEQYQESERKKSMLVVDRIAAAQGEGMDTDKFVLEMIEQDLIPFYGVITRIIGTNQFLPDDVDISWWRRGLPGETRQAVREWWVAASPEERQQWLISLESKWEEIRKGPYSETMTRYMVIENLMGVFTDELMYNDNPDDGLDRFLGNLDVALGGLLAAGTIMKRGKGLYDVFKADKGSKVAQLARASGNRGAPDALDPALKELADELEIPLDDLGVAKLAPPRQLQLDFGEPIETARIGTDTPGTSARRQRVLEYQSASDATLIDDAARKNATTKMLEELQAKFYDLELNHKMSGIRGLPNNVGVEVTATFGRSDGQGYDDLYELLETMRDMDPYQEFRILKRGPDGNLQPVEVSFESILRYYADGTIPPAFDELLHVGDEIEELRRLFGYRHLSRVETHELRNALETGWAPKDSPAYKAIQEEIYQRTLGGAKGRGIDPGSNDPMLMANGDELFVQMDAAHYWDSMDMQTLDGFRWWEPPKLLQKIGETFGFPSLTSAFRIAGRFFPPITKFERLYDATRANYLMEEASLMELQDMLRPYMKLSIGEKRQMNEMIEYVEEYAREFFEANGFAKAPTMQELIEQFPTAKPQVIEGYKAYRDVLDTTYEILNQRMYREYNNQGYRTMRGLDDRLPSFHGKPMGWEASGDLRLKPGNYYDPVNKRFVNLSEDDLIDLVNNGGGALKLEFPIDVPSGGKASRVLARPGDYQIGSLSKSPLARFEGYHFRFYEDPLIVYRRSKAMIDGVETEEVIEEAIGTLRSEGQRLRWTRNMMEQSDGSFINKAKQQFVIRPFKEVTYNEGTLFLKEQFAKEGRLFWDKRDPLGLKNMDGNRAEIADPLTAMQRGLAMATRQTTQEGLFRSMKQGFINEFKELPAMSKHQNFELEDLRTIEEALLQGKANASGNLRVQYKDAIEYIRYIRSQMGTQSQWVPKIRSAMLALAKSVDSIGSATKLGENISWQKLNRYLQTQAMEADPFARLRRANFGAFMVLRPFRQVLLQSSQVTMLGGLAPGYIYSPRMWIDAMGLRRGISAFRKAGFDDGWSDSKWASKMGYSKAEYKRLVEEYQRSGFMGTVNTHSFVSGGKDLKAMDPGADASMLRRGYYRTAAGTRKGYNALAQGFELGEQNNLTFSWLVSLHRYKKKNKIKDITKMDRSQWEQVAKDADGLAMAMTRPNKFGYQSGFPGLMLQFISFQHRAALTMVGLNPAVKGVDVARMWMGMYAAWGTNMWGVEDNVREMLAERGLSLWGQTEVMPGVTVQDLLVGGLIESVFNGMLNTFTEADNDLNIGILAPGAAITELYKGFYDMLTSPLSSGEVAGPTVSVATGFLQGWRMMQAQKGNEIKSPAEKILQTAKWFGQNTLPIVNDAVSSLVAYQTGVWAEKDGDSLGIQSSTAQLAARGLFGIRTNEEYSIYRSRRKLYEHDEFKNEWVKTWKPILKASVRKWADGEMGTEDIYELSSMVYNLTESLDESVRTELYQRIMSEPDEDGKSITQVVAESATKGMGSILQLIPHIQASSLPQKDKDFLIRFVQETDQAGKRVDENYRGIVRDDIDNYKGRE